MMTEAKYVEYLINLSKNGNASNSVRAIARMQLEKISQSPSQSGLLGTHRKYLSDKIQAYLDQPHEISSPESLKIPDGAPIGIVFSDHVITGIEEI